MVQKGNEATVEINPNPQGEYDDNSRPFIGVFTMPMAVESAVHQRPSTRMRYLVEANRNACTNLYFFSVHDVNAREGEILGTHYNYSIGCFEQCIFPLPDVLYDRVGELGEDQAKIEKILRENDNIKKINPVYIFDKWKVYEELGEYKDIKPCLPPTIEYTRHEDILWMMEEYGTVYIKDRMGNRGLGVVRVLKKSDGVFELSYFIDELHTFYFYSFNRMVNGIDRLFKDKRAVVQCGIDVIKIDECNVDLRATLQRNKMGEMEIIAYPVRIGSRYSPITSTRSGSKVCRFEEFFKTQLNYSLIQIEGLRIKIEKFLFKVCKHIEDSYGIFGEIGIDFALDKDKRLWFIECNAKPGKDTLCLACDEDLVRKAFLNPLEYAKYLYKSTLE